MRNPDVFEVLASEDQAEQERVAATRAKEAAKVRVTQQLGSYVRMASNATEFASRMDQVSTRVAQIVADTCDEYGAADPNTVLAVAVEELHTAGGHKSDCGCGFCKNKGKLFEKKDGDDSHEDENDKEEKEEKDSEADDDGGVTSSTHCSCDHCGKCSDGACCGDCPCVNEKSSSFSRDDESSLLWRTAAGEVPTGDSFNIERIDLPKSDGTGLGDTGAVPTDKSRVPAEGLKPIDVTSERNPLELQSVKELERGDQLEYGTGDPNPAQGTRTQVDADTGIQAEHNVADHTDTWTGTEGLADPVTRETITSKWHVL